MAQIRFVSIDSLKIVPPDRRALTLATLGFGITWWGVTQTVLNESLDNKILPLYALGMSYEAISEHLNELYSLEVSTAKISQVTDKLLPVITDRQIRKYTKNKGAFTSENALIKLIYCACPLYMTSFFVMYRGACQKVMEKWNQPMHNWALIILQLQIFFEGRFNWELS